MGQKFEDPATAVIMGSYLSYEPEMEMLGGHMPAADKAMVVLSWAEAGKVREGVAPVGVMRDARATVDTLEELGLAYPVGAIVDPARLRGGRIWHGPPTRAGEQWLAETGGDASLREGRIVGYALRYLPVAKNPNVGPRVVPFVVVRDLGENAHFICRLEGGVEWMAQEGPLLPQLVEMDRKLRGSHLAGSIVKISPAGRGGYWQLDPHGQLKPQPQMQPVAP